MDSNLALTKNRNLNKKAISLRPFNENTDFEWYYRLSTSLDSLLRWRFYGSPPTREQFAQLINVSVHCQFVAEIKNGNSNIDPRIGVVVSYNYDNVNNVTYLGVITNQKKRPLGIVISTIFIEYLFNTWPLRKIYLEMPEFNVTNIKSGIDRFFVEESRLKNHFYSLNKYHDYLTFAIYKEDFFESFQVQKILNRYRDISDTQINSNLQYENTKN